MMKLFSISFLLFVCLVKTSAQKGIDGLINAEKNFAAYSVSNSTKEAFLKFLDSAGIVFDNGKPVNGIETWNKREKRPGVLNWHPQYADISSSGDFGYTSGPWTFRSSSNDTISARGQYTTVWNINKNGEWKFLVDLGVSNTPVNTDTSLWKVYLSDPTVYKSSEQLLLKAEKKFIQKTKNPTANGWFRKDWYKKNFSRVTGFTLLNRNNRFPVVDQDPFLTVMKQMPNTINYKMLGSGIASSGDLGYVYGTTEINGKTDNYLRIWRLESDGWKLVLEVLRY